MKMKIVAHSDGACKKNPGKGGWGATYTYNVTNPKTGKITNVRWSKYGGKPKSTNNEMELTAFLETLKLCPTNSDIVIYSDSSYVLGGLIQGGKDGIILNDKRKLGSLKIIFTGWIKGWSSNGWKTKKGDVVKNLGLWKSIISVCETHIQSGSTIRCVWVKGHNGDEGNEIADTLANIGATLL